MSLHLGVFLGKIIIKIMRLLGRNATTLPGNIIFTLFPKILFKLTDEKDVILVTGTNGKTTTVRILCSIYNNLGYKVITNVSGANLITGILTTLIEAHSNDNKNSKKEIMILEIDEAVFAKYSNYLNPSAVALTNLFRDQLDRYGELSTVRNFIITGIKKIENAKVILCSDDSLSASIQREIKNEILFFGLQKESMQETIKNNKDLSESSNCIFCKTKYIYESSSFGHLGIYSCPGCGFERPTPHVSASFIHKGNNFYKVKVVREFSKSNIQNVEYDLPIPGEHNVYNSLAACAIASAKGVKLQDCLKGVLSASSGFGRMERFIVDGKEVCIVLVKNPVGLDNALKFLENAKDLGALLFLLNDKVADGVDVSWIWDVDFESRELPSKIYVSGTRCYDMALRIKYSKQKPLNIDVSEDFVNKFEEAFENCPKDKCFYILPNYTSMLSLRKYLEKKYNLKGIWE